MKALVLASGGAKGAYQAGLLARLAQHPAFADGFEYISGSSAGALNAAALAQHNQSEFPEAAKELAALWHKGFNILKWRWPFGLPGLWKDSFASGELLRKFVDDNLDIEKLWLSDVNLSVSAVRLEDGFTRRFIKNVKNFREALLASSAIPGVFPPVRIDNEFYVDGAVKDDAPLKPAIDAGADEVLVVTLNNPDHIYETHLKWKAMQVAMQAFEIQQMNVLEDDLMQCSWKNLQHGYRKVTVRVVCPSRPLESSLNFSKKALRKNLELGRLDAEAFLS